MEDEKPTKKSPTNIEGQICAKHFAAQVGAVNSKTNAKYECTYGSDCNSRHETLPKGASKASLLNTVNQFPEFIRRDIIKAISDRLFVKTVKAFT